MTAAPKIDDDATSFSVEDPATGEVIVELPEPTVDDVRAVVAAAELAREDWKRTPAVARGRILRSAAEQMQREADDLAATLTREQGKPLAEARGEILYAAAFLEWYAGEGERAYGQIVPSPMPGKQIMVTREAAGVAAALTPWNFPAATVTRKVGGALAAGCPVITKPAEATPLTALAIDRILHEAGLPAGVSQVITTARPRAVVNILMADERVKRVSFTGSTRVGRELIASSAHTLKRLSLELGGHAPVLVFDDADLGTAVTETMNCKFRAGGQTCMSANRIYVQEGIYDEFVDALVQRVQSLRVGNGFEEVDIGPLINEAAVERCALHVSDALERGASVLGRAPAPQGRCYFPPTVLAEIDPSMLICREETFGPVVGIRRFSGEAEGLQLANASRYALAAYVFTQDADRRIRMAEGLRAGCIGINDGTPSTPAAPFGGMDESGFGREGGSLGLDEFLDVKYVSIGHGH
jgi:succinate-semialdehyde dehydrogenase/glutarate-semialdehyde dehydrogenase